MDLTEFIQSIVDEVRSVPGVQAIVLGGSRARGAHTPSSDIDLGIYYDPQRPLDLKALGKVATNLDDEKRTNLITEIGGWGPWINGGGWLQIQSMPVDFLYKDLEQINSIIDACINGQVDIFYQPGHPFGFTTAIYLAEIAVCQTLWDPEGVIQTLKNRVVPYPVGLQKALIGKFAWEVDFSIRIAHKSIERADVAYAAGCIFRGVMCMLQVLFALNKEYWLNEKGAVALAENFAIKPTDLQRRVTQIFSQLDASPKESRRAIHGLEELSADFYQLLPS